MKTVSVEQVIAGVMELIGEDYSHRQMQDIKMILYMVLARYDIVEAERELSTERDINQELLKAMKTDMQLRGCTDDSIEMYQHEIRFFERFTNRSFLQVQPADVMQFLAYGKIVRGWKDSTYNTKLRILRKFYDFLVEYDYMDKNPCRKIKETKVEHVMGQTVDSVQRETLRYGCTQERDIAIMDMLYSTGIRVSELCRLNRADINMETMSGKVYGKGKKERVIYFSGQAKVHLRNYLENRTDDNPALFVSLQRPYGRLSDDGVRYILRKLAERNAQVEGVRLTPHVLRRSIGTDMLNRGAPIDLVADKLGHANIDTTRQCYAAYSQASLRQGNMKYAEI